MELPSRVHPGTVASSSLIWVSVSRLMLTAYHSHVRSSAERPRQTPLHAVHERLGATMTSFAGWQMPLRYGSETAEHLAVRRAAGLFDLSHMGEITVTGPGAGAALDYALVAIQGPEAAGVLAPLAGGLDLGAIRYYAGAFGAVAGHRAWVARTGYTGEDGFEVFCRHQDAPAIWEALSAAGVGAGLV